MDSGDAGGIRNGLYRNYFHINIALSLMHKQQKFLAFGQDWQNFDWEIIQGNTVLRFILSCAYKLFVICFKMHFSRGSFHPFHKKDEK